MNIPKELIQKSEELGREITIHAYREGYMAGLRAGSADLLFWAKVDETTVTKKQLIQNIKSAAEKLEKAMTAQQELAL